MIRAASPEDGDAVRQLVLAVAPAAQGKEYGRVPVAFAEADARRRGCAEIRLYTHVRMTASLALYSRLGFRETGRVSQKGYERIYMAKAATGLT